MVARTKELNIIICGVGGQGIVLMSELLGHAAVRDGLRVRGSEILGMSQRGGSVVSNIRIGKEVYAPITPEGECHLLAAMEPSEALRNIHYLTRTSLVILSTKPIIPYTVYSDGIKYPDITEIVAMLESLVMKVITVDATALVKKVSNLPTLNIIMLGALLGTGSVPIKTDTMRTVIREYFSGEAITPNINAFNLGYRTILKASPTT